jgi:S-disulfanyl-L-cysteine oxidoreductase SoxD
MYKLVKTVTGLAALTLATGLVHAQEASKYAGIGRIATPAEVAAWDIDVRPDFKGLPKGSGTAEQGQELWDAKCASCHGTFGESNEVFTPIVGGTTAKDIQTGRVASLTDPNQPQRTTLMKVPTVSTLYDYVYRAMPWNAPRSLSADETYALVAYMLALGEIVPEDFTLSDKNIAEVQARMPNRNGMTTQHGMWTVSGKPDVNAKACMTNCVAEVKITSTLPDFARNAHENIAEQNRTYGPYRGIDSTKPPLKSLPGAGFVTKVASTQTASAQTTGAPAAASADSAAIKQSFTKNNCAACHAPAAKGVGPSIAEVAKKYQGQDVLDKLNAKVKNGGAGAWGAIPMPPHSQIPDAEISRLVQWMLTGS